MSGIGRSGHRDGDGRRGFEPNGVVANAMAERSLDSLRSIERTIDVVTGVCEAVRAVGQMLAEFTGELWKAGRRTAKIDPEGNTVRLLDRVQESTQELARRYGAKREAELARAGGRDDDGLIGAYDEALACLDELFNVAEDMKTAIVEHDVEFSPRSGPFESVDELLVSLRK